MQLLEGVSFKGEIKLGKLIGGVYLELHGISSFTR